MTRILVLGAGGQVGQDLLLNAHRFGVDALGRRHAEVDIADAHAVTLPPHSVVLGAPVACMKLQLSVPYWLDPVAKVAH